jgi:hypothetical protein
MLRRYTWESQKKKLQHYKRRQPETSVLYQIVYHGHEDLQHVWEPRFQHQYGCSIQDDIDTYTTKDGAAHEFDTLEFLADPINLCRNIITIIATSSNGYQSLATYKKGIDLPSPKIPRAVKSAFMIEVGPKRRIEIILQIAKRLAGLCL